MSTLYKNLIATDIYESLDSLDNPIQELAADEQFTLVEANLGKYFQFSKIRNPYIGTDVFIRSCFLAPVDPTAAVKSFQVVGEEQEVYVPNPIKTKDAELDMPYIEGNCVNIVIDTGLVAKQEVEDNELNIKVTALEKLVKYYNKNYTEAQIQEFAANPFNLIETTDVYYPTRPGKGITIKLCVKKHYFDAFSNKDFKQFEIENIHKNFLAVNFKGSELEETVEKLVKVLEKYDSDISKFSGSLSGINFKKLSSELRRFLSKFKKFISVNNVSLENIGESKFELGFDISDSPVTTTPTTSASGDCAEVATYRLEYVLFYEPYGNFLPIGISNLTSGMSTSLSKLLIGHKDIMSASLSGMGWMDLCKNYFAGEFKINFTPPSAKNSNIKKPKTQLESELKNITADHADLSILDHKKSADFSSVKSDPKFRTTASELLLQSRDVVGDNFLANLPEILANVDDLNSLYSLVFDKVSIKDLVDLMMEKMTENLNLPDINEIKLRGVLKALTPDLSLQLIDQFVATSFEMQKLSLSLCEIHEFKKEEIDNILSQIQLPTGVPVEFYFINYKSDGTTLGGILVDGLASGAGKYQGDLAAKLAEKSITNCRQLAESYQKGNFRISDYFQSKAINEILCNILSEGIPANSDVCVDLHPNISVSNLPQFDFFLDLRMDILDIFASIDKSILLKAIDGFIKDLFKMSKDYQQQVDLDNNYTAGSTGTYSMQAGSPSTSDYQMSPGDLFDKFIKIPKINIELDKLSLTKKKMLNKIPNVNIDMEMKKKDVNFSLPSIKSVNPSFDFSNFEFTAMADLFGTAVSSIEDAIVDGIEKGLVNAFKGILNNVLDSMNMDMPNIDSPDFGGLNMNDLLDASNGITADGIANLALDDFQFNIDKFNPCADDEAEDISDFVPSAQDIKDAFSQMSACMKPLELTRILKGQRNKKDFENMTNCIQDPRMRQALDLNAFDNMMDLVSDLVDIPMLEELEAAYDNKEVMVSVCKNNGIPYCLRDIKDTLEDKYSSFTDDEICELIEAIVDETKDSLVDAIGSMKEDFQDNLPFNEDPCSFMPKPKDIPAMNFVNDLAFDAIFDPIELEYKSEAVSFPDLMMQTTPSDEYIKLRLEAYDSIISQVAQDRKNGLFDIQYEFVIEKYNREKADSDPDFEMDLEATGDTEDVMIGGMYNQEFGNHYFGNKTPIYYLGSGGQFKKANKSWYDIIELDNGDYAMTDNVGGSLDKNLYVKNSNENLTPMPELKNTLINSYFTISGHGDTEGLASGYVVYSGTEPNRSSGTDNGYRIKFYGLNAAERKITLPDANLGSSQSPVQIGFEAEYMSEEIAAGTDLAPMIWHDKDGERGTNIRFPSIESLSNPECITTENSPVVATDVSYPYVESISGSIIAMTDVIINRFATNSIDYQDRVRMRLDGWDNIAQVTPVGGEEGRDSLDLIAGITAETAQVFMRSFAESELFDTQDMLSFLFDTEDVNLFNVQSAKNSAKDEFNEDCDFTDDNSSSLKSSSIKKLIYLTIRIYVIDAIMQACFVNSVAYEEEMNDFLKGFIFDYMKLQLAEQKDSYYSTFKELYSKEYGEELETPEGNYSTSFSELITEIYKDISPELPKIFPNASPNVLKGFLDGIPHFLGNEEEFAEFLYETYMASRGDPNNNSRFFIKLVYEDSRTNGEKFYDPFEHDIDVAPPDDRSAPSFDHNDAGYGWTKRLSIRLCYVCDFAEIARDHEGDSVSSGNHSDFHSRSPKEILQFMFADTGGAGMDIAGNDIVEANPNPLASTQKYITKLPITLRKYRSNFMKLSANSDGTEGDGENDYSGEFTALKIYPTVSYNYVYRMGDEEDHPHLVCLPLAQTILHTGNSGVNLQNAPDGDAMIEFTVAQNPPQWEYIEQESGLRRCEWIHDSLNSWITGARFDVFSGAGDSTRDFVTDICTHPYNRGRYTIYDFVVKRLRAQSYFDLLRRCMISKMHQLKPETALAFQDTKDAIRRAILSLSQEKENFDYIEQEAITNQLLQSAGVGTDPDFSPKAKKMALMTVPLIIKGMAEMFDPNTKLASIIRTGATAAGLNVSPPVASLMALPFNIIPFAPGPPITPLGLTYLATSFLEPKERKQLSDVKRGKNTNPEADEIQVTSPEEQMELREAAAAEAQRVAGVLHQRLTTMCKKWIIALRNEVSSIYEDYFLSYPYEYWEYAGLNIPNSTTSIAAHLESYQHYPSGMGDNEGGDINVAAPILLVKNLVDDILGKMNVNGTVYIEYTNTDAYDINSEQEALVEFLKAVKTCTHGTYRFFDSELENSFHNYVSTLLNYFHKMEHETVSAGSHSFHHMFTNSTYNKFYNYKYIMKGFDKFYFLLTRAFSILSYSMLKILDDEKLVDMSGEKYDLNLFDYGPNSTNSLRLFDPVETNYYTDIKNTYSDYVADNGDGNSNRFEALFNHWSDRHYNGYRRYIINNSVYKDFDDPERKNATQDVMLRYESRASSVVRTNGRYDKFDNLIEVFNDVISVTSLYEDMMTDLIERYLEEVNR